MTRLTIAAASAAVALAGSVSLADFITPDDYGWSRGADGSTYFEWDIFTSTTGGNVPDVGSFPDPLPGDWDEPDVAVTQGDAVITSSGRIYPPSGPINVRVTTPNYNTGEGSTTLLLQVRTIGNELDYDAVRAGGEAPVEIVEVDRQSGSMGEEVEVLFVFELDGNGAGYVLDVPTSQAHCSIDGIAVDTFNPADDCTGDFNGDGNVNTQDVIAFLNAWAAGDSSADINGDGSINTQDVIAFLNAWAAGC